MNKASARKIILSHIDRVREDSSIGEWRKGFKDGRLAAYHNALDIIESMD